MRIYHSKPDLKNMNKQIRQDGGKEFDFYGLSWGLIFS